VQPGAFDGKDRTTDDHDLCIVNVSAGHIQQNKYVLLISGDFEI